MASDDRSRQLRAALWMLASGAAMALMGAIIHALRHRCDWQLILGARSLLGFLIALLVALVGGVSLRVRVPWPLLVIDLCACLTMSGTYYALTRLPTADALLLASTAPLWVTLAALLYLRQRPGVSVWLALVCGLVGIALVQRPHLHHGGGGSLLGAFAALGAGMALAGSMLMVRRVRHLDSRLIVAHFSGAVLVASLILLALSPGHGSAAAALAAPSTVLALCAVAVLATFGSTALTVALKLASAPVISVLTYVKIPVAILLDLLLWSRVPQPLGWLGFALTIGPLVLITLRPNQDRLVRLQSIPGDEAWPMPEPQSLISVEESIAFAEKQTNCEIRAHLEPGSERFDAASLQALFDDLGMTKTRFRNGILIAVSLTHRQVAIVADVGIGEVIDRRAYERLCDLAARLLESTDVAAAVSQLVTAVPEHLATCFPPDDDDVDELPNSVSIGAA